MHRIISTKNVNVKGKTIKLAIVKLVLQTNVKVKLCIGS